MYQRHRSEQQASSKSGVIPRPVVEPETRREAPPPETLPEADENASATTGVLPVVSEGEDQSAERDDDNASGQ